MTPTVTPTVTPTSTPGVFQFKVSPKPVEGQIHFQWGTTVPADEVYLKVFTSGFRLVEDIEFSKDSHPEYLTEGGHEYLWDGRDDIKRPMPPGIYLCFIEVHVDKKKYAASGQTEIP